MITTTTAASVQLYTVRTAFEAAPFETLERLAAIGFTQVEPWRFVDFEEPLRRARDELGLSIPTAHCRLVGADQEAIFESAARLGIQTVVDPRVQDEHWGGGANVAGVAALLEDAARVGAAYGIGVGYHNHAFELETRSEGRPVLAVLADAAPHVRLEVDTYWAAVGGVDPVQLLTELGDRVFALHLKDGPITPDTTEQLPLGEGAMLVRQILDAAPTALRVLELDDSRVDAFVALGRSLAYLNGLDA